MIDQQIAGEVLERGDYGKVLDSLGTEFALDPECESFDTLLWLLNLVGYSPKVLALSLKRPPELLTGESFFEVGIALHKCTQTELLMRLAIEWSENSDRDFRPVALLSMGNVQAGRVELARERAEESLELNPDQPYLRARATGSQELAEERLENNLVWLLRLARAYSYEDDWCGVLETTSRILELAPDNPMASRLKATALWKVEGLGPAFEFSMRRFEACDWFEPFHAHHCKLCWRMFKFKDLLRAMARFSHSRESARRDGEVLVARFKPVAFVQSVAGWHDF